MKFPILAVVTATMTAGAVDGCGRRVSPYRGPGGHLRVQCEPNGAVSRLSKPFEVARNQNDAFGIRMVVEWDDDARRDRAPHDASGIVCLAGRQNEFNRRTENVQLLKVAGVGEICGRSLGTAG
jgi:hypothetical protein